MQAHSENWCVCVCACVCACVWCRDSLNICDMTQMLRESDAYAVKCILFFHPLFIFYHTCQQGSAACRNYPCVSARVCARMFVTPSDVMRCIRRCWCLGVKNPIRASGMVDRYLTGSQAMLCVRSVCACVCVRACICACVCVWKYFNTSQRWISARQHGDTVRER